MSKKRKIIIIVSLAIMIPATLAYCCFGPIFHLKMYEYHEIEFENDHGEWWITFEPASAKLSIPIVIIFESPYQLSTRHDPKLKIDRVEIEDSEGIIFASNDFKRIINEWSDGSKHGLTICEEVKVDYGDYDLVIYYSLEEQGKVVEHIFKEPLKTNFTEEKISLLEIMLGV